MKIFFLPSFALTIWRGWDFSFSQLYLTMPEAGIKPRPQVQQARVLSITQLPLWQNKRKDGNKGEETFKKAILKCLGVIDH